MTIESTTTRKSYDGNDVSTMFVVPFKFLADEDLVVILHDTTTGEDDKQILDTDYTVTGAGSEDGGAVTFMTAPATGKKVVIYRDPSLTQGLDLEALGDLPAEEVEKAFDRLTMIAQRLDERVDRSLQQPDGDEEGLSMVLPPVEERASKYLGFDANGEPIATAGTAVDADVSDKAVKATGASIARALAALFGDIKNVKNYGAKADGVTDDSAAFAAAYANGGLVFIPAGTYKLDSALTNIPSGTTLMGAGRGATVLDFTGVAGADLIQVAGSLGTAIAIDGALSRDGNTISTASDHGLSVGDWVYIRSGDSAHGNSGVEGAAGRLGDGDTALRFGEIVQVLSITDTDTFVIRGGLRYGYPDATTTIAKITPKRNVRLEGFTVKLNSTGYIKLEDCWQCDVVDVECLEPGPAGVIVDHSWNCAVVGVHVVRDPDDNDNAALDPADHQGIKVRDCSFNVQVRGCHIYNPTQGIDITYTPSSGTNGPCQNILVEGCHIYGASFHAITTHDGGDGHTIRGNHAHNCEDGVFIRSRHAQVIGNFLRGNNQSVNTRGVSFGDAGWYVYSLCSDNKIERFATGVYLQGASAFNYRNVRIDSNFIYDCDVGVDITSNTVTTQDCGISITNNSLIACISTAIKVAAGNTCIQIDGNKINQAERDLSTSCIEITNCTRPVITNNTIYDPGVAIKPIALTSVTDADIHGNTFLGDYDTTDVQIPTQMWENARFGGLRVKGGLVTSWTPTLDDDTSTFLDINGDHCTVIVSGFRSAMNGIAWLSSTPAASKVAGAATFAATTGALSGTTGTDGDFTVAMSSSGRLHVENRTGFTETVSILIIGGEGVG